MTKAARFGRLFIFPVLVLVGGGKNLRLQQLHRFVAAFYCAVTGLNAQHFAATIFALKTLA